MTDTRTLPDARPAFYPGFVYVPIWARDAVEGQVVHERSLSTVLVARHNLDPDDTVTIETEGAVMTFPRATGILSRTLRVQAEYDYDRRDAAERDARERDAQVVACVSQHRTSWVVVSR